MVSYQHLGLVLALGGTIAVAFSVRVKRQYAGEMAKVVDTLKRANPRLVEPTEATIAPLYFYGGLILIAVGTILQW